VDLGDFIADPFPGKHFPPSGIILSQKGRIIKKRNSLSADYAARRSRNQNQVIFREEFCSGLRVIPEIPPSPPFSKGGLGGISETRFPIQYSLENLESLPAQGEGKKAGGIGG